MEGNVLDILGGLILGAHLPKSEGQKQWSTFVSTFFCLVEWRKRERKEREMLTPTQETNKKTMLCSFGAVAWARPKFKKVSMPYCMPKDTNSNPHIFLDGVKCRWYRFLFVGLKPWIHKAVPWRSFLHLGTVFFFWQYALGGRCLWKEVWRTERAYSYVDSETWCGVIDSRIGTDAGNGRKIKAGVCEAGAVRSLVKSLS